MEPLNNNQPIVSTEPLVQNQTPIQSQNQIIFAGFWRRLLAYLVDFFILMIIAVVIGLLGIYIKSVSNFNLNVYGQWIAYFYFVIYFVYFTGSKGQTPGKSILKIKVVKTDTLEVPGYKKAFLREVIGRLVSGLFGGIGYLWILFDPRKQAWHDKIAGTTVIRLS